MSLFHVNGARIKGISAAVPPEIISNRDYELLSPAEREVLIKTTGVEKRHIAHNGETTGDLGFLAAEQLIRTLGWQREEIDLLIMVSQSPDYFLPATSIILQHRLGLPKTTAAFDILLGCSGYVYGLSVIASMMSTGGFRKAILIAGDISSAGVNIKDKSTWPLFGDCATATAFEYNPSSRMSFNLQSDGSGKDAIIMPHGGLRRPITPDSFTETEDEPGITRNMRNLRLNGVDVFNFSTREAPSNVNGLLQFAGKSPEDVDLLIMHQANLLMNETIRKKLKFPLEKTPYSLREFGNTSSASIPLTLVTHAQQTPMKDKRLLLASFGVGLSWASCFVETENLICPPVIIS
jgi:3-oxoacyl-[acyl-carrier-protein] synthase-3